MRTLRHDLLHTWRTIRARPGATTATVAVLGLGIGLTTAIFSLADPFVLRPLPYADPDRLAIVSLSSENRQPGPFPMLLDFESRPDVLRAAAAYTPIDTRSLRLRLPDAQLVLVTAAVSRTFFAVLGVPISLPREWDAATERREIPVVLLPEADPRLRRLPLGTAVWTQDGSVVRIVGALPSGFLFPRARVRPALDAISPLAEGPLMEVRISPRGSVSSTSRTLIARLNDGVSPALAEATLGPPASNTRPYSLHVESLRTHMTGGLWRLALGTLAAGLLIALGCAANVANLLLARGTARSSEFTIRTALGASGLDLARLVLIELGILCALGVAAGVACAALALTTVQAVIPAEFVALGAPAVTWRVTAFAIVVGLGIMAAGVLPAFALWRTTSPSSIAHGAIAESRAMRWLRFAMAAGQSAVAMILLSSAVLLGRSFLNLTLQDTGFADDVVVASVSYPPGRVRELLQRDIDTTVDRLRRIPGVSMAAAATGAMVDSSRSGTGVTVDGKFTLVQMKAVTPGYFEAVGASILAGRALEDRDRAGRGLLVNRRAAAMLWPDGTSIGQLVRWGKAAAPVVGVVADTFDQALDERPGPMLYTLLDSPASGSRINFVLRSADAASAIRGPVERTVSDTTQDAIVTDVSRLDDRLAASVDDRVFATLVATMFAAAGVGVCAFGLVGVVSFVVARRTREIAIRSALGAEPRRLRRLVMRQALTAAVAGSIVGLTIAYWSSQWLASLLYGVEAGDVPTLLGGATLMLALVAAASWLPSSRALRLSPTIALRME